jgi:hypothetical protein
MLSFIFVIVLWSFWVQYVQDFFYRLFICIADGDPVIKRGEVEVPLTGLTPPHFCARSTPGPEFPTSYVVVFLCSVISFKMTGDYQFCWYLVEFITITVHKECIYSLYMWYHDIQLYLLVYFCIDKIFWNPIHSLSISITRWSRKFEIFRGVDWPLILPREGEWNATGHEANNFLEKGE